MVAPHIKWSARGHRQCQSADLLREHLASIGCDPLAFRIAAMSDSPQERTTTSRT
jgi:hypothetical protein